MQLVSLNKHLSRLEKHLDKIKAVQDKGCNVESSLGDVYLDLREAGAYLERTEAEKNAKTDPALAETIEKYKNLLVKFESIAEDVKPTDQGMVMASKSTLPDFLYALTSRNRAVWKLFEKTTTVFGVGMILFTLISVTYYLGVENIPFAQFFDGAIFGINVVALVAGVILGLCVHEFAHGVVLANNGIKIKRVGFMAGSIVGGFVEADETTFFQAEPGVHLRFNAVGIGTNALLAVVLAVIGLLTSSQLLVFLALGNLFFGFINSYPISPLDGGWVYEDLVKLYVNSQKVKEILLFVPFMVFILWIILFVRSALG